MKNKLSINDLKVKSFITNNNKQTVKTIKGGGKEVAVITGGWTDPNLCIDDYSGLGAACTEFGCSNEKSFWCGGITDGLCGDF